MKVLFVNVPSRPGIDNPPDGVLAVASATYKAGYEVKILDFGYITEKEIKELDNTVTQFKPGIIGFGGITASYRGVKQLSFHLNSKYPDILLVAGGVLTSVKDLILTKTPVEICFDGEAEYSFVEFLEDIEKGFSYEKTPGISYLEDDQIVTTPPLPLEKNLDVFGIPEYHLIDLKKYLTPMDKWINHYYAAVSDIFSKKEIDEILNKYPYISSIQSSRGCTHRCAFCYRHMVGIRQNTVDFVSRHIRFLMDNYNINCFCFGDELTTVNKKWMMDFCDAIENLGIIFMLYGVRANRVNEELIRRLKEVGCIDIQCGYESGSDEILHYIKKGTTREDNLTAAKLLKKYKIINIPEMIIGFPIETEETINQSITFLKEIDTIISSVNFALPFPETPLWDYCIKNSLITNKEEYVLNLSEAAILQVNMTGMSDAQLFRQRSRLHYEVKSAYYLKRFKLIGFIDVFLKFKIWPFLPEPLRKMIKKLFRKNR